MCHVKGCGRPVALGGKCALHGLQGYYRTEVTPGAGLIAVRLPRPPKILPRGGAPQRRAALAVCRASDFAHSPARRTSRVR